MKLTKYRKYPTKEGVSKKEKYGKSIISLYMSLYPYESLAWFHAVDTSLQTQWANKTFAHKLYTPKYLHCC